MARVQGFEEYMRSHVLPFGALIIELGQFCPVECAHCHVESDTSTREKLSLTTLIRGIEEFSRLTNARFVYLTGGEPFSHKKLLHSALEHAMQCGLRSYVLTSAYWAKSRTAASRTVQSLPQIDLVGISFDQYHAPRVNLAAVVNAARALQERETYVFIALGSLGPHDTFRRLTIGKLRELGAEDLPIVHYPLLARGKGAGLPELEGLELHRPSSGGCRSIGAPVLTASGSICACCHTTAANNSRKGLWEPLTLTADGDVKGAASRFAGHDFYRALRAIGPSAIAAGANIIESGPASGITDICQVCDQLRSEKNWPKVLAFLQGGSYPIDRIRVIEIIHEGGVMHKFRETMQ